MIFNMVGGGGGSSTKSTIIVSIDTGSTVAAYSDSGYTTLVKTATEKSSGEFWLIGLDNGTYYIKATLSGDEATTSYTITEYGVYRITIEYRPIPEFTYSGTCEVVEDDDTIISDIANYKGNWKIRFLTSGTLSFSNLYGATNGIEVFLVGGGAGSSETRAGGGGGYTVTSTVNSLSTGTNYAITIGSGNTGNTDGGSSSAFGETADGGKHGYVTGSSSWNVYGGNGGTGGSSNAASATDGANGNAAAATSHTTFYAGTGQGTTTREFGENTGTLYATGGGTNNTDNRADNTGDGAYGSSGVVGGSGIVIIRNVRS